MAVRYAGPTGFGPSTRLADHRRAVWRVTVARTAKLAARNVLTWPVAQLSFRDVVRRAIDLGFAPVAYAIGGIAMDAGDGTAVFDMMTHNQSGAATARDLADRIERNSEYWTVTGIEMLPGVPGESAGGARALDSGREDAATAAREAADADSLTARLRGLIGSAYGGVLRTVLLLVLLVAIVAVAAQTLRGRS